MYGSDTGQPVPSLYTKGLSPLCDIRKIVPVVRLGGLAPARPIIHEAHIWAQRVQRVKFSCRSFIEEENRGLADFRIYTDSVFSSNFVSVSRYRNTRRSQPAT